MDWTEGYASDVEYTAGFYREQGPAYLNFVFLLNNIEPVPLDRPFTYFELGFGRGLTSTVLAASNPQGRFYAADFNPAHVAGATSLADAAGIGNLTLLENSFEQLATGDCIELPQFDFITLHGIYTWVTAENQAHIVAFIERYLKPGGVVYLSYNAMPGWSAAAPLQRLLVEHADLHPGRSDVQIKAATQFVLALAATQRGYFAPNDTVTGRVKKLGEDNAQYLVHEYMHHHWQPLYHADVARALAPAKLEYVGAGDLALNYPSLFLKAEQLALIKNEGDPVLLETAKDYLLNSTFRRDVFVRGARKMPRARAAELLSAYGLCAIVPREKMTTILKVLPHQVSGKAELYEPLFDLLAEGPKTLAQLLTSMPSGLDQGGLLQMAALLVASFQAELFYVNDNSSEAAQRLNVQLARHTLYGDAMKSLASPLLGNGLGIAFFDRMVLRMIHGGVPSHDVDALSRQVWAALQSNGSTMIRDGQVLTGAEDNLAYIRSELARMQTETLPLWRRLKML